MYHRTGDPSARPGDRRAADHEVDSTGTAGSLTAPHPQESRGKSFETAQLTDSPTLAPPGSKVRPEAIVMV